MTVSFFFVALLCTTVALLCPSFRPLITQRLRPRGKRRKGKGRKGFLFALWVGNDGGSPSLPSPRWWLVALSENHHETKTFFNTCLVFYAGFRTYKKLSTSSFKCSVTLHKGTKNKDAFDHFLMQYCIFFCHRPGMFPRFQSFDAKSS